MAKSFYDYVCELPRELLIKMLCDQQPKLSFTVRGKSDQDRWNFDIIINYPDRTITKINFEYTFSGIDEIYKDLAALDLDRVCRLHVNQAHLQLSPYLLKQFMTQLKEILADYNEHPERYI
jgi:hypothetical protein